jgi:hypothetical protein
MTRYPRRSIRSELIDGLIRDWRELLPAMFSLDFAATRTRHGCIITERRICAAETRDDDGDLDVDRIVSVGEITIRVDRNRIQQDHTVLAMLPLLVLAERIAWNGTDDAALIRDIDVVGGSTWRSYRRAGGWRSRQRMARGTLVLSVRRLIRAWRRRLIRCHAWVAV